MKSLRLWRAHTLKYLRFYMKNSETKDSLSFTNDSCIFIIYRRPGMLKIVLEMYAIFVHTLFLPTFDEGLHTLQIIHFKPRS